jgi:maltose alpha-D-glucosyltransferase/alpha-amylase
VIYYGDEIGMGDNIYLGDRHGVRTPMQWSPDRNAGFSEANPQRLYSPVIIDSEYLFATVNVENQQKNPHSLLWWMKRLIALRQNYVALRRGTIEILTPENAKVLAFTRDYDDQSVLMVANLSRFVQYCELDLSRFAGRKPIEMFGQSPFPVIGKSPYSLTLGPHAFYWFSLESEKAEVIPPSEPQRKTPTLNVEAGWQDLLKGRAKRQFELALRDELPRQRWFHRLGRQLQWVQIVDAIPLGRSSDRQAPGLFIVRTDFTEGEPEAYVFTLSTVWEQEQIDHTINGTPPAISFPLQKQIGKAPGLLYDATLDRVAVRALLELMIHRKRFRTTKGELAGWSNPELDDLVEETLDLSTATLRPEARDGGVIVGEKLLFKLARRAESGTHPDLEIGRFLDACRADCPPTLKVLGAVEYCTGGDFATVAILQEYVPNTTPAIQVAIDSIGRFLENVMALSEEERPESPIELGYAELAAGAASPRAQELLGGNLEWASLLGRRTAELHVALTSRTNSDFTPEPFSQLYQRSLYQASRKAALRTFQQVRKHCASFPEDVEVIASQALAREKGILDEFSRIVGQKLDAQRIRCHGDFHLGHVLYTGKDFLIVDFDGDPGVALSSRRVKRSPLADIAAMIHSLEAAGTMSVRQHLKSGVAKPEAADDWRQAAEFWSKWAGSAFLRAYLANETARQLLPELGQQFDRLLTFHLFQEAIEHLQKALDDGSPEVVAVALERIVMLPKQ